ncbi:hypothetical protein Rsub_05372 [Raphidocelis subcapitata]|uniref:Serine aminopeptidase S33 domain-containing protein n=1 Tax=Raphidocelis subcapitata TaxID=307507 RepID=A0A2V0NY78_9CHLO|nr:hypothetical protein Rsub_05372 [Raphidocelis subcapitata]|eukprot:GBF92289.1 hypothetical protein Rsub_05372 [Raphidocelis subcapitata]
MQERRIEFANARGELLVGTLREPSCPPALAPRPPAAGGPQSSSSGDGGSSSGGGAAPALAILCHGYMSDRNSELLLRIAGALAREGVATLRFDFSGNGESEGRFRYGGYRSEARDIAAARAAVAGEVVNLAARCDVRGGVERRLGAAVLQRLSESGAVELRGRCRARGEFGWTLTRDDLEDRLSTDVAAAAAAIPPGVRVLTAHGTDDADVPVSEARLIASLVPSHELLVIEGGDHLFSGYAEQMALLPRVAEFVLGACRRE